MHQLLLLLWPVILPHHQEEVEEARRKEEEATLALLQASSAVRRGSSSSSSSSSESEDEGEKIKMADKNKSQSQHVAVAAVQQSTYNGNFYENPRSMSPSSLGSSLSGSRSATPSIHLESVMETKGIEEPKEDTNTVKRMKLLEVRLLSHCLWLG